MSGEGVLTGRADDGSTWTYTGGVLNGLMHGKGKTTWSDGTVFEGDWVHGKLQGKGKVTVADGSVYEGGFIDGRMLSLI
jgi:hypothetical protein